MELIIIGENRLKIMLTGEDMARYELSEPCAESLGARARRALRSIVADAHAKIGFDTDRERLLVQLYTSRGGGCEIFVTKLEETVNGGKKLLKLFFPHSQAGKAAEVYRFATVSDTEYTENGTLLTALCDSRAQGMFSQFVQE